MATNKLNSQPVPNLSFLNLVPGNAIILIALKNHTGGHGSVITRLNSFAPFENCEAE